MRRSDTKNPVERKPFKRKIKTTGPKGKKTEITVLEKQEVEKAVEDIEQKIEVSQRENDSVEFISTGIDLFDLVLGGGFPLGKIINVVGDKSSGKTALALHFIAYCRHKFGNKCKWFYDDAEAGFSFDSQRLYGFDIMSEDFTPSETIEQFSVSLYNKVNKLKKDEFLIYVLDSLDALTSEEEQERDRKDIKRLTEDPDEPYKGTYGMERQKKLSQFFRLRKQEIRNKRCILIIISQVRANIGVMFGAKYTRTGGKALDMYASIILWLAEVEKHSKKYKDRIVGVTTKVRCTKNKVGLPFRECFLDVLFDYGVDNLVSNLKFLYDLLTPTGKLKTKSQFDWINKVGNPEPFNTFEKLIKYIEDNNLEELVSHETKKKWNKIEYDISSKDRKRVW